MDENGYKSVPEYLDIIGWSIEVMAEKSGVSVRACSRWFSGRNPTPDSILQWLDELAKAHVETVYHKPQETT